MANKKLHKKVYNLTAVFEPAEEGGFTVTIPSLLGCISEGKTFEEATRNIREAAELYLGELKGERSALQKERNAIIAPVSVRA